VNSPQKDDKLPTVWMLMHLKAEGRDFYPRSRGQSWRTPSLVVTDVCYVLLPEDERVLTYEVVEEKRGELFKFYINL